MKKYTAIKVRTERREILSHLLRLSNTDRYLRFCHSATDDAIRKYVENINLTSYEESVFAVFDNNRQIVAMSHIAPCTSNPKAAEVALSVDEKYRNKGVGSIVFERAMLHCESKGITDVYMNCLASNIPVQRLVKHFGVRVITDCGEAEAHMKTGDKNAVVAFLESVQNDVAGEFDLSLRHATHQWVNHISTVMRITRRHMRNARRIMNIKH